MKVSLEDQYRWKFLRLNKEYREDVDEFLKRQNADDSLKQENAEDLDFRKEIEFEKGRLLSFFAPKWNLVRFYHYEHEEIKSNIFLKEGVVHSVFTSFFEQQSCFLKAEYEAGINPNERRYLNLLIDLKRVGDVDDLTNYVKNIIIDLKRMLIKPSDHKKPNNIFKQNTYSKKRLDDLLKVYELRATHLGNKKWKEVLSNYPVSCDEKTLRNQFTSAEAVVNNIQYVNLKITDN